MKPKIGIDLDQVVFNLIGSFIEAAKFVGGNPPSLENWREYSVDNNCPRIITDSVFKVFSGRRFFADLNLIPYSAESLKSLSKYSKLFAITARQKTKYYPPHLVVKDTQTSLENSGIYFSELIFDDDKERVSRVLSLDFMIEDNLENALAVSRVCPVYLFDYPYNRKGRESANGNLRVVKGFEDETWWLNFMKTI